MKYNIPEKILIVLQQLESAGHGAFLVGGCVRDLLRGQKPKDWDITTSAKPEKILEAFPDGKYENTFGTVILPSKYIISTNLSFLGGPTSGGQIDRNYILAGQKATNVDLEVLSDSITIDNNIKKEIIDIAKKYLKKIECPTHSMKHAERVTQKALKISENYKNVNKMVLEIICWFHDTGRAIGIAKDHTKNSQKIIKKELRKYFNNKELTKIIKATEHSLKKSSLFLEQQILKEADIIEGLNIERINMFETDEQVQKYLEWIKNEFTDSVYYPKFITPTGKKLLEEAVNKFNKENFKINIKAPDWDGIGNIEITTYRIESTYSDNRRPDEVKFAKTLEEDLGRRDFTCNAIALKVKSYPPQAEQALSEKPNTKSAKNEVRVDDYEIIDLFNGQQDIKNQAIRAVGDANKRFNEDALRMMRAIRFAAQLSEGEDLQFLKDRKGLGNQNQKTGYQATVTPMHLLGKSSREKISNHESTTDNRAPKRRWWIGENTFDALKKNAELLRHISPERIGDEFQKIILSNRPAWGVELLVETNLMKYIIPELYDTIGVRQNKHHYYGPYNTVYKHMLAALKTCPSEKLEVRLAAFFHDIGKPKSKRGHGYNSTFYGHEYVGARMTKVIMERLKFPKKVTDKTVLLVKNHMFYYNTDEVSEKGVRKVIRKVGLENINDLIDVRIGDRLGSGIAKAVPYKLRHFKYMVEKVSNDPISVKDLKINGDILLADYDFKPGPQIGAILEILLAEVLDDPKLNTIKYLADRAIELQKEDLKQLRQIAKQKIKEEKQEEEKQTKGKYWVK